MFFNPLYLEELTLRDVRLNWVGSPRAADVRDGRRPNLCFMSRIQDQRVDGTSNGKTIMDGVFFPRAFHGCNIDSTKLYTFQPSDGNLL